MSAKLKLPYLEKVDERGNLQVWVVDGSHIRGHIDEEFTNFVQFLLTKKNFSQPNLLC